MSGAVALKPACRANARAAAARPSARRRTRPARPLPRARRASTRFLPGEATQEHLHFLLGLHVATRVRRLDAALPGLRGARAIAGVEQGPAEQLPRSRIACIETGGLAERDRGRRSVARG